MAKAEPWPPEPDPDRDLTLGEVIGHDQAREVLKRSVASGRLPQAILLTGPEGIGKKTLAWALIKEVLAQGEDPRTHRGCGKVVRGVHPDVLVRDASGSAAGQIKIDPIRDAEDWAARSPLEAPKKFLFISPAEALNLSAANCLLKLLEEPLAHLLILLTAGDAANLLPTIRSRCTPFALDPVPEEELLAWLRSRTNADDERVVLAARLAEGRPGFALSLLEENALESREAIVRDLELLKDEGFLALFAVADRLGSLGGLAATLRTTLVVLRDALAIRLELDGVFNRDLLPAIERLARGLSPEGLWKAAMLVAAATQEAPRYYSPQSQAHFMETLIAGVGRALRRG